MPPMKIYPPFFLFVTGLFQPPLVLENENPFVEENNSLFLAIETVEDEDVTEVSAESSAGFLRKSYLEELDLLKGLHHQLFYYSLLGFPFFCCVLSLFLF